MFVEEADGRSVGLMRLDRTSLSIPEVCLGMMRFGNTIDRAAAFFTHAERLGRILVR